MGEANEDFGEAKGKFEKANGKIVEVNGNFVKANTGFSRLKAGQVLEYTGTQFAQLVGLGGTNLFLNVHNVGPVTGHWKFKATHVG